MFIQKQASVTLTGERITGYLPTPRLDQAHMKSFSEPSPDAHMQTARAVIDQAYLIDETEHVTYLKQVLVSSHIDFDAVKRQAVDLVGRVRARSKDPSPIEAFMREYDLSSEEGVILMCLAEALLRIPDNETAERLIADKLSGADWEAHVGKSGSVFVNASTWGLMLTGKLVRLGQVKTADLGDVMGRLVARSGEPVVRMAIRQAMKIMGHQYVMGRTIQEALERSQKKNNKKFRYSFDMLGEAALTGADAERYRQAYAQAIEVLGAHVKKTGPGEGMVTAPSISVKLSALHPRYHPDQRARVLEELVPTVLDLATLAKSHSVALTLDAEEADRLDMSLDIFERVLQSEALAGWDGLGLAVQAYQKRAWFVIDALIKMAQETKHRIPVRLVKGAYWDTEIKMAQVEGLEGYPVFTRKVATDLSYLACAHKLLQHPERVYPQFATHNAHTIAAIGALAGANQDYEYQRLHGMGFDLYEEVFADPNFAHACRVYAPVGAHKDLLPYLVRRLLENGANTSFVNRIVDASITPEQVVTDPLEALAKIEAIPHPSIPLPAKLYGEGRQNSQGLNLSSPAVTGQVQDQLLAAKSHRWQGGYRGSCKVSGEPQHDVLCPFDQGFVVGSVAYTPVSAIGEIVMAAERAHIGWDGVGVEARAAILMRVADLIELHRDEFMALCALEAGKTVRDSIAEIREAVDFCRYYAQQARLGLAEPISLPGPTGERNQLFYRGKGIFICISPWNFPLAIFVGQVVAALVTGNTVIAKPAPQTSLMGTRAVELMHEAGVPKEVLHNVPGSADIGSALTSHPSVTGVAFTGSTQTAKLIAQSLLNRQAPLATLIAETGGQNAMIVDSSALPEQVIKDVISSAFLSAGQRCSALRVLCLQEEIADGMLTMLEGAVAELKLGDPRKLATDIGPIIDAAQREMLTKHAEGLDKTARLIAKASISDGITPGHWFAPRAYLIDGIHALGGEVFGPILHVVRYSAKDLDRLIDQINATGYGLTLGIHSRIDGMQTYIAERCHVGNCYINRNMTGAVVGVQPFGGEGLSGTGPKAGGPNYLYRFVAERVRTVNTAAVGGNASLLALSDQ